MYDWFWNCSLNDDDDDPEKASLTAVTSSRRRIRHERILQFRKSGVSIAALTAICGVIDGIATVFNTDRWFLRIIFASWGAFCVFVGITTLWRLRNHPDFTFRKIICAPCFLLRNPNKKEKERGERKNKNKNKNNNENNNENGAGNENENKSKSENNNEDGNKNENSHDKGYGATG